MPINSQNNYSFAVWIIVCSVSLFALSIMASVITSVNVLIQSGSMNESRQDADSSDNDLYKIIFNTVLKSTEISATISTADTGMKDNTDACTESNTIYVAAETSPQPNKNNSSQDESIKEKDISPANVKETNSNISSLAEDYSSQISSEIVTTDKSSNGVDSKSENKTENKSSNASQSNNRTNTTPKEAHLNVPHYSQTEEMPTGCELVSTRMVLKYYGFDVSYNDIIENLNCSYLKMDKNGKLYGDSPFNSFIGNPKENSGFGCYPPVIIDLIDSLSPEGLRTEDTSSIPLDFLAETYLNLDIPVLVWVTIDMGESYLTDTWYLTDEKNKITNEKYRWRAEEHCMVLVGYDEKYYYLNDPLSTNKTVKYKKSLVEKRYEEVGCYSLIIRSD